MFMIRLIATGAIVTTTIFSAQATQQRENPTPPPPTMPPPAIPSLSTSHSAQGHSRPLPSLPKTSQDLQILKEISQFLIREIFEPAYEADMTMIKQIVVEEKKPERYGSEPYFTASKKEVIQDQLKTAVQDALEKVNKKLGDLEEQQKTRETPFSNKEVLRSFGDIYDTLNVVRKTLSSRLSALQMQALRTKTLKERQCLSTIDKIQLGVQKTGVGIKKFVGMEKYSSSENKKSQE